MKSLKTVCVLSLIVLVSILSACGGGKPTATQSAPNLAYTQIWETVAAGQTQTAGAAPLATETPENSPTPKSTNTPLISPTSAGSTPDFTAAPAATNTKSRPSAQASCDNFQFVSDVTIPDGSEIEAGTSFVKTWRIKNLGPCEWNEDYMITFGWGGEGTDWKTANPNAFSKVVKVGDTIDLSMELVAPDEAGSYGGVFRVKNEDDVYFGPTLTTYIVVK